jgi:3',5'-nucleoside bisphosphate phosphatase
MAGHRLYADLHTHTLASDGMNTPADNVKLAYEAGLAAIAITDHDTVAGVSEAIERGKAIGVEVVPGVEISTIAGGQDIHVLGYYIDIRNPLFLQRLEGLRTVRKQRNLLMIARLNELGMELSLEEVEHIAAKKSPELMSVGRPHIAEVMMKKGYVTSHQEAFDIYLGTTGAAYVNPPRIRPEEAIDWIHEAGGAAVLAHPGLYHDDPLVEKLAECGLDGIEVYHSDHTAEDEQRYSAIASRYGLLITAGSDFHGERSGQIFHGPIGSRKIEAVVLQQLQSVGGRSG